MKTKWLSYKCPCCKGNKKMPDSETDCLICGGEGVLWNEVEDDE